MSFGTFSSPITVTLAPVIHEAEDCLNDPEGADVFGFRGKFTDDPFYEKYRD